MTHNIVKDKYFFVQLNSCCKIIIILDYKNFSKTNCFVFEHSAELKQKSYVKVTFCLSVKQRQKN